MADVRRITPCLMGPVGFEPTTRGTNDHFRSSGEFEPSFSSCS